MQDTKIRDKDLQEVQEKIEQEQAKAPKVNNPCPYCSQETPDGFLEAQKVTNVTLNLKDANRLGAAKAKEERLTSRVECAREDMNEFIFDTSEKYNFFNPNPGIDWDEGVMTGVDANGDKLVTDIRVDEKEIRKSQKLFSGVQRTALKARRASTEKRILITELAEKYGWNDFPCDIRNNAFVAITNEILKQQNIRLEQIEQELKKPRLMDDKEVEK